MWELTLVLRNGISSLSRNRVGTRCLKSSCKGTAHLQIISVLNCSITQVVVGIKRPFHLWKTYLSCKVSWCVKHSVAMWYKDHKFSFQLPSSVWPCGFESQLYLLPLPGWAAKDESFKLFGLISFIKMWNVFYKYSLALLETPDRFDHNDKVKWLGGGLYPFLGVQGSLPPPLSRAPQTSCSRGCARGRQGQARVPLHRQPRGRPGR